MIEKASRESRKDPLCKTFVALITLAFSISLIPTGLLFSSPSESGSPEANVPAHVSYTTHAPISIASNLDFSIQATAESWSGDGSLGNPYVIQDYNISATSATGIFIQNTNVHFIVKDCYIHDGGPMNAGIYLFNCMYGILDNNTCPSNFYGIDLFSSSQNTIINNTCSNNLAGIYLYLSSDNTLDNNTCSSNFYGGIYLDSSSGNTLINNTCQNNEEDGIRFMSSSGNTISNNDCSSNNECGIFLQSSDNNAIMDNDCLNDWCGIRLMSSSDNFLTDNDCNSDNEAGIYLGSSGNNTICNNTCSNNLIGISLVSSSDNSMRNNTCGSNGYAGIGLIWSSEKNTINKNDCSSNNEWGINIFSSNRNIVSYNNCSSNSFDGVYLEQTSSNNTINYNNCSSNNGSGIFLRSSDYNIVGDNDCLNNQYGIYLRSSSDNSLSNNNCSSNNESGIFLQSFPFEPYCSVNTISWNQIFNNTDFGLNISSESNNTIWNNAFIGNNGTGSFYNSSYIQAYDNGTNNRWNSSAYGNYWSDWTNPDNVTPFGIVDIPYNISGSAGARDYFPLVNLGADLYPPVTATSLSGAIGTNGWYKSPVTVSLHATDLDGGVNSTFYRIGTSGSWTNYSSSFSRSGDGNSIIQFYSMDNASNNESVKSIVIEIDKTDPILSINQTTGFETNADYAIISWTGSDATSGISYFEVSVDRGVFASTGMKMSYNFSGLTDGVHNVTVRVVDAAGNAVNRTILFTVDTAGSGAGTSGDLLFYGAIVAIIVVIMAAAIITLMWRKKSPPMKLDEMKAVPPEPPAF